MRSPITLIWENEDGNERCWAGSRVAIEQGRMQKNKVILLQPMTSYHIVQVRDFDVSQFKDADVTRLVNCYEVTELCEQLRRAARAMSYMGPGEGLFAYCKQGCNRTPVWCIAWLMAKTQRSVESCSDYYTSLRSLTWLAPESWKFLRQNEGAIRTCFHNQDIATGILPSFMTQDYWEETARSKRQRSSNWKLKVGPPPSGPAPPPPSAFGPPPPKAPPAALQHLSKAPPTLVASSKFCTQPKSVSRLNQGASGSASGPVANQSADASSSSNSGNPSNSASGPVLPSDVEQKAK